tara:strand:- start:1074 stop:1538 length:465 start_codon:yes stop_codon:yes gene_type:complete
MSYSLFNLNNKTSFNSNNPNGGFMFDTSRFTDVTTNRQSKNGTQVYRDNANPGVYYSSHRNGYVRRTIKTTVKHINNNTTTVSNNTTTYQINPRCERGDSINSNGKPITSFMIHQGNQRLARIQQMADKFNAKTPTVASISTQGNTQIIVTPVV